MFTRVLSVGFFGTIVYAMDAYLGLYLLPSLRARSRVQVADTPDSGPIRQEAMGPRMFSVVAAGDGSVQVRAPKVTRKRLT
jgi:hypothetical protein